jgi:uncharacterized protein
MTKILLCVMSLCVFAVPTSVAAQESTKPPTINVNGSAEISVQPDQVVFSLEVKKRNKILETAKGEADAALAKIIELTKKYGIKSENVRTDYISVEMRYQSIRDPKARVFDEDGDEIGTRVFLGYEVSTTVIVKLLDLTKFERFFAEALQTGVSEIASIKFETGSLIEYKAKAREMAMKAAYQKAAAMAGAINQTIGKAILVSEGTVSNPAYSNNSLSANITSGPVNVSEPIATFAPGAITVNAQVSITFLLY